MPYYIVGTTCVIGYDEYDAFVVKAPNAEKARLLAVEKCGDYTNKDDFSKDKAIVTLLTSSDPNGVVLASFNAG